MEGVQTPGGRRRATDGEVLRPREVVNGDIIDDDENEAGKRSKRFTMLPGARR
jgi:hypothetical protein